MAPKRMRGKAKAAICRANESQRGRRSVSSARTKEKNEVSFNEKDVLKLWVSVGKARDLSSDGEIARVLLNVYFNTKPKETQSTQLCQYCHSSLALWCSACKSTFHHDQFSTSSSQPSLQERLKSLPVSVKTEKPLTFQTTVQRHENQTAKERGENADEVGKMRKESCGEMNVVGMLSSSVVEKACVETSPSCASNETWHGGSEDKEGLQPGSDSGSDASDNATNDDGSNDEEEDEEEEDDDNDDDDDGGGDDDDDFFDDDDDDDDSHQDNDNNVKEKTEKAGSVAEPQNEDDAYFCPYCSRVINGLVHRAHMLSHFEETNSLTCIMCNKTCAFSHTLYNHITIPMSQLKCSECGYVSTTRCETSKHAKEHKIARERFCLACNQSFPDMTKKEFNRHRAGHAKAAKATAPPDQFLCPECGKTFRKKRDLKMHLTYHNKESPFPCSLCDKAFKNKACLQQHELHHGEKTQQCEICGAKFFRKAGLRRHEQKHTGRKFQCSECGRQFSSKWDLHKHTELVHQGIRRFQCGMCAMKFYDKGHLQTHMRTHTGETPFHCDQCPAKFKLLEALKKHKNRHLGVKPYVCEDCGQVYSCEHSFKKHKQKYHSSSVYPCSDCPQVFVLRKSLDFHRRMCHTGSQEVWEV